MLHLCCLDKSIHHTLCDINASVRERASRKTDRENIRLHYQLTVHQYQAGHDVSLWFSTATTGRRLLCSLTVTLSNLTVLILLNVCLLSAQYSHSVVALTPDYVSLSVT